jgi:hypothetical protein
MINAKTIIEHASKSNGEQLLSTCHQRMQDLSKHLEKAKCKLALAVDFNLGDLFRLFVMREADPDSLTRGCIDAGDIARVSRLLGVFSPQDDRATLPLIQSLVRSLDGDGDGQLLFTDVSRAFLSSFNEDYQRLVIDRPTFYDRA